MQSYGIDLAKEKFERKFFRLDIKKSIKPTFT